MNHEKPVKMTIMERHTNLAVGGGNQVDYQTVFYACPKYMLKDDEHPKGHEANEPACGNRLSFSAAEEIMKIFAKTVEEDLKNGIYADYKGFSFRYKNIDVQILDTDPMSEAMKVGILNRGAIS